MSIVRIIAVDPRPRKDESDLQVYQVPEFSREHELLTEVFSAAGVEHVTVASGDTKGKRRRQRGKP